MRSRDTGRASCRGLTLVELAVASFLLAILLTLTHLALVEGVKKQQALQEEIELQQDALAILTRLSRETAEGHSATFWPDRTPGSPLTMPGGEPVGFVFLSPRANTSRSRVDPPGLAEAGMLLLPARSAESVSVCRSPGRALLGSAPTRRYKNDGLVRDEPTRRSSSGSGGVFQCQRRRLAKSTRVQFDTDLSTRFSHQIPGVHCQLDPEGITSG